ncbi:hypothetical protein GY45DRAFT_1326778 [Cubamyces sp. BRFM 1775]|nr:hypothetical protein GY45DRAFT_1326778 [Cubamyces sp. BRFM 1775]
MSSSRPDAETLFSYTSTRWLCNDEAERKARHVSFDPDGLERVACASVGAQRCISWTKIGEGSFNRIFLLEFDNGTRAAIRIPFPIVGNVERAVASEVATMCYIRDRWPEKPLDGFPFPPKVFAWSSSYDNPARTPYIILEYAEGVTLRERWPFIEGEAAGAALRSIVTLETTLLDHPFSQHGSLYFADDVSEGLRTQPLHPENDPRLQDLDRQMSQKYKIGPTANREWWRGPYARIDADRGPWPDMQTMIRSAADLQLRAIDQGVIDFTSSRIKSNPSDIPLLRRVLDMCIRVAPSVVPSNPALTTPVLNHPDISLTNLIVPEEGYADIHAAIDWQGATVSPFCMQAAMPPAIEYTGGVIPVPVDGSMPPWPSNFDTMTKEEQDYIRIHHRYACRHRMYHLFAPAIVPWRSEAWSLPHFVPLANLVPYITRCVTDGPANLLGILIYLQQKWSTIAPDESIPCPIDFTPEELVACAEKVQRQMAYERNVAQLYKEIGCLNDGSVKPDEYEAVKARMERCREEWDESAAMKGPFPFLEGSHSYYLS